MERELHETARREKGRRKDRKRMKTAPEETEVDYR
jgi:hypothetical protein